jgi:hypothetical protein
VWTTPENELQLIFYGWFFLFQEDVTVFFFLKDLVSLRDASCCFFLGRGREGI